MHASSDGGSLRQGDQLPLISGFSGVQIRPDDPAYEQARSVWNGSITTRPRLIARPGSPEDVTAAVVWASERDLRVSVLGGGHNVSGVALCEGLVLDMSAMRATSVDPYRRRAHVQGGATWRDVDAATQTHGLAVPGGVVSTTGVGGLTLGGGLGWLRRALGASSDQVTAFDVVLADGSRAHVDQEHEPDLFWALRGGGGGLCVVVAFEFALHPVGPLVTFASVAYPAEAADRVVAAYRSYASDCPDEVTTSVLFGTVPPSAPYPERCWNRQHVTVAGMYAGDASAGEEVLAPLRELGGVDPWLDLTGKRTYVKIQQMFDAGYPAGRHYYWTSLFLDDLPKDAGALAARCAAEAPSALSVVAFWHLGGALARTTDNPGAYQDRQAPFLLGIEANNADDAATFRADTTWARSTRDAFLTSSSGLSYINLPGSPEDPVPSATQNWRDSLDAVRRRVDPESRFTGSRSSVS